MLPYFISNHCRYVKGIDCSAIYDLEREKVYSLNQWATRIIDDALAGIEHDEYGDFINFLCKEKLLNILDNGKLYDYEIESRINYVWLELTGQCNCNCLHCYGDFGSPNPEVIKNELSLQEWKEVISTIKKHGGNAIQFIGGEPLMYPNFEELLLFAHGIGIENIDIFTNGIFLNEKLASNILYVGASVRVSLYGFDEVSHDRITQIKGSFSALNYNLKLLKKMNIPTRIAVVIMQENQDCLDKMQSYIESIGHNYTGFDVVRHVTHCSQKSHAVTNVEVLRQRYMEEPGFFTSSEKFNTNRLWNSCWFGKFAVTSSGDIIPCIFARNLVCGNIRSDSFESIKEKLLTYWRITKDHIDTCRDCEYRYACDDCRPLAMGELNNLYSKYPRCCYEPHKGEWCELT